MLSASSYRVGAVAAGVALAASLFGGCLCNRAATAKDYFHRHEARFVAVRDMIHADQGRVRGISKSPVGVLASVSGARGHCGSLLRGGEFPWACLVGERKEQVNDLAAAARLLDIPIERLREYDRTIPASSIFVEEDGRCSPKGSITFWLADPDTSTCQGKNNIVWSPIVPVVDPVACVTTVPLEYRPLGQGFYEHACVSSK